MNKLIIIPFDQVEMVRILKILNLLSFLVITCLKSYICESIKHISTHLPPNVEMSESCPCQAHSTLSSIASPPTFKFKIKSLKRRKKSCRNKKKSSNNFNNKINFIPDIVCIY